jgi:hypothetical protein
MLNPGWAIIVPAVLYVVAKGLKATAGAGRLSPARTFAAVFLLLNYLGGLVLVFLWFPETHSDLPLPDPSYEALFAFFLALNVTLLLAPVGAYAANTLLAYRPRALADVQRFWRGADRSPEAVPLLVLALIVALHGGVLVFHWMTLPVIPIGNLLLESDAALITLSRETARKDYPYIYPVAIVNYTCLTFITGWVLIHARRRRSSRWWGLFAVLLLMALFEQVLTITRSGVGLLLGYVLFVHYFAGRDGNHRPFRRYIVLGTLTALAFPALLTYLKYRPSTVAEFGSLFFLGFGFRVFLGQALPMYFHFAYYPAFQAFTGLEGVGTVAWLIGEPTKQIATEIFAYMHPHFWLDTATAPAPFTGYLYALGGWWPLVIGGFVVMFAFQALHLLLGAGGGGELRFSLWLFLCYSAIYLNVTSPFTVFSSYGIGYPLLYVLILRALGVRPTPSHGHLEPPPGAVAGAGVTARV